MKTLSLFVAMSLISLAGISQTASQPSKQATAQSEVNAAKADVLLIDKKTVTKKEKRKKPRREKAHKECSRMKS